MKAENLTENLTVESLKTFATECADLLWALRSARKGAEETRREVDQYIQPLFVSFYFTTPKGEPCQSPKDLFIVEDEEKVNAFYAACDKAHREHGYDLEPGYCPALVAEANLIKVENSVLEAATKYLGINFRAIYNMNLRRKALDLFAEMEAPQ